MQNAVDAASLAASQEIHAAVYAAGQGHGSATIDANSIAVAAAREMAAEVAAANGVYVDPDNDVKFGKRVYNPSTGEWTVQWDRRPYNVVQVTARRSNPDTEAPDGEFPLAFGWADRQRQRAARNVSPRPSPRPATWCWCSTVSASMNDDSSFNSSLQPRHNRSLLDGMWNSLVAANPKWPGTRTPKFPSTGFGNINSYYGTYVSSTDTATIRSTLGLNTNVDRNRKYPFPQAGPQ